MHATLLWTDTLVKLHHNGQTHRRFL